jgi:nucleoside-diphosphate-sugar epimerase
MVAIAGGHGNIALRLTRRLTSRGETVVGLVRKREHMDDVRAVGGTPVLCDLEHADGPEIANAIRGASAVVFAAGAGPSSGADRKLTVDRDGAIKLLEVALAVDVPRYLIISSVGAENPPDDDDVFSVYLRAKAEADAALQASDLAWAIVRPGRLTDDPGTDHVRIDVEPFRGEIPRDDVAAVLDVLLQEPRASRRILYVNAGETAVEQALEAVL